MSPPSCASFRTELKDRSRFETRYYISSAALTAARAAEAVRGHWPIENSLHWVLDVVFNDDQSRLRKGHGARNMAVVRHFAINLVRATKDKRIKLGEKAPAGAPNISLRSSDTCALTRIRSPDGS